MFAESDPPEFPPDLLLVLELGSDFPSDEGGEDWLCGPEERLL